MIDFAAFVPNCEINGLDLRTEGGLANLFCKKMERATTHLLQEQKRTEKEVERLPPSIQHSPRFHNAILPLSSSQFFT